MKRRYLTVRGKQALLDKQGYRCAVCNDWFGLAGIEYDHSTPVALGNDRNPDQAICKPCHASKTKRDVKLIAKAKRLHRTFVLGQKRNKRKIASRGFDRTFRRRFDGTVVRREKAA